MWSSTIIANELLPSASQTESYPLPPSLAISEHSSVTGTPQHIRDWLMFCPGDSPVNHSAKPVSASVPTIQETCGRQQRNVYALFDQDTASLRMLSASFLPAISEPSSLTWPRSGTVFDGVCYRLAPLVRHIHGKGCSYWPTPTAAQALGGGSAGQARRALAGEKRLSGASIHLKTQDLFVLRYGMQMKPTFYEWVMGWVPNWSASGPLAMDKFRQWLEQHGIC